jgi:NAD(P)-dependent dehydrogenase (short-subunit alcohol dehydrogenase family)
MFVRVGGLGSTTALLLRSKGCRLALLYAPFEASRRREALVETYGSDQPEGVRTYEADITSESAVSMAFEYIATDCKIDGVWPSILINSAGYVTVQPLEQTSVEEASKNFAVNLVGPFILSNAFFRVYREFQARAKAGGQQDVPPGRIVSLSSQAAHLALDGHGAYCASKAGLNGLVRCQANEWGQHGITSNTVSPTVALTALGIKAWSKGKQRDDHIARIPAGRFVEPSEVARAIEWLCQDGSGMVNGADIRIDGGFTISGGFTLAQ